LSEPQLQPFFFAFFVSFFGTFVLKKITYIEKQVQADFLSEPRFRLFFLSFSFPFWELGSQEITYIENLLLSAIFPSLIK